MTKIQNKITITCLLAVLIILIGAVFCTSALAEENVSTTSTTYVIFYNINGGHFNSGVSSYYICNGEEYTVLDSSNVYRDGYTFGGWYDNDELTGTQYTTFPANYPVPSSGSIMLYAKWIGNTYEVNYHVPGIDAKTVLGYTDTYTAGKKYNIDDNIFSEKAFLGYNVATLLGWYDNPELSGDPITYISSSKYGDINLYAKWEYTKFTITYHDVENGSYDNWALPLKHSYTYGELLDYYNDSTDYYFPVPTKAGISANGWYDNAHFAGDTVNSLLRYIADMKFGVPCNIDLYALWSYTRYTISYNDPKNGSYDNWALPLLSSYSYLDVKNYIDNGSDYYFVTPNKAYYTYYGWYDNANFEGNPVRSLVTYVQNNGYKNITLYAKCTADTYYVDYIIPNLTGNNQSAILDSPEVFNVETGYTIRDEIFDKSFGGYTKVATLLGWYDNSEFAGVPITNFEVGTTGNKTVYAKWIYNQYTITYNDSKNGSYDNWALPLKTSYGYNEFINDNSFNYFFVIPNKTYYFCEGWYDNNNFEGNIVNNLKEYVELKNFAVGDIVLYAKWVPIEYKVNYSIPNESGINQIANIEPAQTYNIETGYEINDQIYYTCSLYGALNVATLLGWYDNAEFSGDPITSFAVGTTGEKTVYAKWEYNTFSISYHDPIGGIIDSWQRPLKYSYTSKEIMDYMFYSGDYLIPTPYLDHYNFDGWYCNENFEGESFTSLKKCVNACGYRDIDLYAKWTRISYAIFFDPNGGSCTGTPKDYISIGKTYIIDQSDNHHIYKENYMINGWYKDSSCTNKILSIPGDIGHDVTVYAGWTRCTVDLHVYIDKTLEKLLRSDWDSDIRKYRSYSLEINDYNLWGKGVTINSTIGQAINNKQTVENWLAPTIKDKILCDMENAYCNAYEIDNVIGDTLNLDVYDIVYYTLDFSEQISEDTVLADVEEGVNVVISRNKISVKFVFVDCDYESIIGQLGSRYDVVYQYSTTPGLKLQFPEESYSTYTVYMGTSIINQYDVYFIGWTLEYCNWQHWLGGNVIGIPDSENVKHELVSKDYVVNEDTTVYAYCSFKSVNLNPGADEGATEGEPNPYATCSCGWCKLLNTLGIQAVSFRKLVHLEDKSLANIFATFWSETWFKVLVIVLSIIVLALIYPIIRLVIVIVAFPIKAIYRASNKASKTLKKKQQRRR
ncbi:MAG: InlB B-repeat-containing protein [Christensenellales bacterium]